MKSKRRPEGRLGWWKARSHEAVVAGFNRKRPGLEIPIEINQSISGQNQVILA
jgi:hypothetical protein